jgi:hypothetical protein
MTRVKSKATVHKPVFDTESILRFAALAVPPGVHEAHPAGDGTDRLTLMLKPDVISLLRAEAARKEKSIEQIVTKLVSKHLGKH